MICFRVVRGRLIVKNCLATIRERLWRFLIDFIKKKKKNPLQQNHRRMCGRDRE